MGGGRRASLRCGRCIKRGFGNKPAALNALLRAVTAFQMTKVARYRRRVWASTGPTQRHDERARSAFDADVGDELKLGAC